MATSGIEYIGARLSEGSDRVKERLQQSTMQEAEAEVEDRVLIWEARLLVERCRKVCVGEGDESVTRFVERLVQR